VTGFLLSGGAFAFGLLALVAKGMVSGTVAHFWKKYLARKDRAHEVSSCPHVEEGQVGHPRPEDRRYG
jgi:ribosomal protein L4